jgi:hypothetical protein
MKVFMWTARSLTVVWFWPALNVTMKESKTRPVCYEMSCKSVQMFSGRHWWMDTVKLTSIFATFRYEVVLLKTMTEQSKSTSCRHRNWKRHHVNVFSHQFLAIVWWVLGQAEV